MSETVNAVVKNRSQTAAVLNAANPVLYKGELGIETDTQKFKFGDGITPWNSLGYASFDQVSSFMLSVLLSETAKAARGKLLTHISNVTAVTEDTTITDSDLHELLEATAGDSGITVTLPTLADNFGRIIKVIKADPAAGLVTVDGEGDETINGALTQTLSSQNAAITMYAGTDEWKLINAAQKTTLSVSAKTTNYTVTDTDNINILEISTGADDVTITLPTLADNQGRQLVIKKVDNGNGSVFISGEGAETIECVPSLTIVSQYNSVTLYAGPSEWGVLSQPTTAESKAVGEIFAYAPPFELDGCKFMNYALLSQTVYAELFSKIGHLYAKTATDAAAAQAAGKFHIPDGHFLFMRGGQSWNITQAAISTSTKYITVPGHGITQDGRAVKLQRYPGQTPTLPTDTSGYFVEYDQLYAAVVDEDNLLLYNTEANAITNDGSTGLVAWSDAGSGTFLLTTQGCYQSDAFQGFKIAMNDYEVGKIIGITSGSGYVGIGISGANAKQSLIDDGVNGTPRTSNETRPAYASLGMQIKVIGTSVSTGKAYDALYTESGWIANSDWTGARLSMEIPENMQGLPLTFNIWISPDSSGETRYLLSGSDYAFTSVAYGMTTFKTSTEIGFYTFPAGLVITLENGSQLVLDTEAWYYYIEITAASLFAVTKTSPLVTLTTSRSVTLETVERTAIIPAMVEESLDIPIVAGTGINEANVIWVKNKSEYIQHILFGTQVFNISPGQRVKFRIEDGVLVWASAGRECIYYDWSHNAAALLFSNMKGSGFEFGKYYDAILDYTTQTSPYYSYSVAARLMDSGNYSYGMEAGASSYLRIMWQVGSPLQITTNNGSYAIKELYKWHEES